MQIFSLFHNCTSTAAHCETKRNLDTKSWKLNNFSHKMEIILYYKRSFFFMINKTVTIVLSCYLHFSLFLSLINMNMDGWDLIGPTQEMVKYLDMVEVISSSLIIPNSQCEFLYFYLLLISLISLYMFLTEIIIWAEKIRPRIWNLHSMCIF